MRHRKKINHLGRKSAHRKAMLANMASSLIIHKRIKTTQAKAKALRIYVEPLVNKAKLSLTVKTDKMDATHLRRTVFSYLKQKQAVTELFRAVAPKVVDRPGGYTRIIKLGKRAGDDAEMAYIELVDFNELLLAGGKEEKKPTRRRRRRSSATTKETTSPQNVETQVQEDVEEKKPEVKEENTAKKEAKKDVAVADDLKKIEGIGPKIAQVLSEAGLDTFAKVADATPEKIREVLDAAEGNFAAHDPETWPAQAKFAAEGKWEELKQWQDELDGGKVTE